MTRVIEALEEEIEGLEHHANNLLLTDNPTLHDEADYIQYYLIPLLKKQLVEQA